MASQSLQLGEGFAEVRLGRDLVAVPDFFKPRSEYRERLVSRGKRLRQDSFGLGQGAEIFAGGFGSIGIQCAEFLKPRDRSPICTMNGHAEITAARRFTRGEHPLLPGP